MDSLAEARAYIDERCSLDGVVEKIEAPYLVIHGARDELVSVEEGRRMAEGPKRRVRELRGRLPHVHEPQRRPRAADVRLDGREAGRRVTLRRRRLGGRCA